MIVNFLSFSNQLTKDPKIIVTPLENIFQLFCLFMAIYWIMLFSAIYAENRDAIFIAMKTFDETPIDKYPAFSLCFKGNKGYSNPLPINVSTDLYLKEFTDIGEHDNSISIQLEMWTLWMDHGLGLSNDSSE